MTLTSQSLQHLTQLAYLDEQENLDRLGEEIGAILDFVQQLQDQDTRGIAPLFHPMDLHQRLRADEVTEADCLAEMEAMAPQFEDSLFLVPQIIETGK